MFGTIDTRSPPPTMGQKRRRTQHDQLAISTGMNSAKSSTGRKSSLRVASALLCVAALAVLSVSDQPARAWRRHLRSENSNSTGSALNNIRPYNYETILSTQHNYFSNSLMFLIFDPHTAEIRTYMKDSSKLFYEHIRSYWPTYLLSRALFQNFPDRFVQNAPPFQLLFTSYDRRKAVLEGRQEREVSIGHICTNHYVWKCSQRPDHISVVGAVPPNDLCKLSGQGGMLSASRCR